ncbi:hypothetical protein N7501_006185 [Penicillium viridicatum]|nr:hypothetical protein N7501_006185 [Penicillium viridicatum]
MSHTTKLSFEEKIIAYPARAY